MELWTQIPNKMLVIIKIYHLEDRAIWLESDDSTYTCPPPIDPPRKKYPYNWLCNDPPRRRKSKLSF